MLAVVFDLDDTLYKERDYVDSGCSAVAQTIGATYRQDPKVLIDMIQRAPVVAKGFDALMDFINSEGGSNLTIKEILEIYREHVPTLHLPEESRQLLDFLKTAHPEIRLGLITDGRSIAQRAKIKALGLNRYFPEEYVIISEEIGADKHSVAPFKALMSRVNPSNDPVKYIYIGDNPRKDFLWPNKMGWLTVQLIDINSENIKPPYEATGDYNPKLRINSLTELPEIISDLRN